MVLKKVTRSCEGSIRVRELLNGALLWIPNYKWSGGLIGLMNNLVSFCVHLVVVHVPECISSGHGDYFLVFCFLCFTYCALVK